MIRSILCNYNDAYISIKGTITIPSSAAAGAIGNNANKKVIFKNGFTKCISKINNVQVDDAQDIDVVMSMYNLIEYTDIYSKTPGIVWQYYRDVPNLDGTNNAIDFPSDNNNSISFRLREKITE